MLFSHLAYTKSFFRAILLWSILLLMASEITAQDTAVNDSIPPLLSKKEAALLKKNFLLEDRAWTAEIPLWIPGFAGEFAYGEVSLEGEDGGDPGDPGDPDDDEKPGWLDRIFSNEWYLKFVFLGRFGYEKNKFITQIDAIAGAMGRSIKFNYNNKEIVQANFRTINLRWLAGYRLIQAESPSKNFRYKFYGYVGVRSHFQKISSDKNAIINWVDVNPTWTEPLFGMQNHFILKRWKFILQADYGGYFVSTKWSSQAALLGYYRTGKSTSLKFGWNFLTLNHESTINGEDLRLKVSLNGPSFGLRFDF